MFNVEQAIAGWRRQMLAVGIKTPVPLEELENHLREEIERQIKSGIEEQQAFETAVRQIGQAELLKTEFRNAGFFNWQSQDTQPRINRVFALVWLAYCTDNFLALAVQLSMVFYKPFGITPDVMLALIIEVILLRVVVASIRLFGGNNKEIRMLHYAAILALVALVPQIIIFKKGLLVGTAAFDVASLVLLRSPSRKDPSVVTQ